jgi:hypothetical protein
MIAALTFLLGLVFASVTINLVTVLVVLAIVALVIWIVSRVIHR